MSKIFIGFSLLSFTIQHWKYLIFNASSDEAFEAEFFFNTLTERVGLWNE